MKIVKFFSLIMLLSIGFVACKDNSKGEPTVEVTVDNTPQNAQAEFSKNMTELQVSVNNKIAEVEKELAAANESAKADIQIKLDGLRKTKTDLENLSAKVGQATAETWADVEKSANQMLADIKDALNK